MLTLQSTASQDQPHASVESSTDGETTALQPSLTPKSKTQYFQAKSTIFFDSVVNSKNYITIKYLGQTVDRLRESTSCNKNLEN